MNFKKTQVDALLTHICENGFTPYFVVHNSHPDLDIPADIMMGDVTILNVSGGAVRNYASDEDRITYSATFGGRPYNVTVPYGAIVLVKPKERNDIYATFPLEIKQDEPKENSQAQEKGSSGGYIGWHRDAKIIEKGL